MFINILIGFFVFLLGLCIGSFLNCVVYRLESKKSLSGRSFCPHCKHSLFWQDLFPVFSFLFLGGKCRYCHKKISIQYPLVELATALIFLLIYNLQFTIFNEFSIWQFFNLIFWFYIASALIIIFIYDLKHYLIPDKILFPAIGVALAYRLFESLVASNFAPFFYCLVAAMIASGFFLLIFLVTKGRGMGFGDVKLAILMGLLLGLPNIFVALFLAFFFGAIIGIILMTFGKKSAGWRMKSEIPFGPFLIIGTFVALFWGDQLIQWYASLFKI